MLETLQGVSNSELDAQKSPVLPEIILGKRVAGIMNSENVP